MCVSVFVCVRQRESERRKSPQKHGLSLRERERCECLTDIILLNVLQSTSMSLPVPMRCAFCHRVTEPITVSNHGEALGRMWECLSLARESTSDAAHDVQWLLCRFFFPPFFPFFFFSLAASSECMCCRAMLLFYIVVGVMSPDAS